MGRDSRYRMVAARVGTGLMASDETGLMASDEHGGSWGRILDPTGVRLCRPMPSWFDRAVAVIGNPVRIRGCPRNCEWRADLPSMPLE
jgi:hypothetical protein